jgi:Outer membrane protein beta-barrel domain
MKKYLYLSMLVCVAVCAKGQDNKLKLGLRAGVGSANQKFNSAFYTGTSPGALSYCLGLVATLPAIAEGNIVIQPQLLYVSKGSGASSGSGSITLDATQINYIEVPINLLYKASEKLMFGAGPYFGYALNGKVGQNASTFNDNDHLKKTDFGYNLTGQLNFTAKIGIAANFSKSLSSITSVSAASNYNSVKSLSLIYMF